MLQALLRINIIFVAGFTIWQFSDGFLLAWETLAGPMEAQWFNVLSALCEGVLGPVLALSTIALSATDERLVLASSSGELGGGHIRHANCRVLDSDSHPAFERQNSSPGQTRNQAGPKHGLASDPPLKVSRSTMKMLQYRPYPRSEAEG